METITIQHPLREITYQTERFPYFMPAERETLLAYRAAHDEAWRMKIRFEKARGETLLVQNELLDLEYDREELEYMWTFYVREADLDAPKPPHETDIRLQVELRDFYLQVQKMHQRIITFYDKVAALETEYKELIDTYFRNEKPLDPLNFRVLDSIVDFHEDRDTDIPSLDKDLQAFLHVLRDIYALLDDYTLIYSKFYTAYGNTLDKIASLMKKTQRLDQIWGM